MTGAQFVQRYPSAVSAEEVYIANGIDGGTTLARGTIVKRIR